MKRIFSFGFVIYCSITSVIASISLDQALLDRALNKKRNQEILLEIPQRKGTVGIFLVYYAKKSPYVLLGQERITDSTSEKSGKYSDFGGQYQTG